MKLLIRKIDLAQHADPEQINFGLVAVLDPKTGEQIINLDGHKFPNGIYYKSYAEATRELKRFGHSVIRD